MVILDFTKSISATVIDNDLKGEGHPTFYNTKISRLSKPFIDTVINYAESGDLQFTEAFKLLNVSGKSYDGLKAKRMI